LLLAHPHARLAACFATDGDFRLADALPELTAKDVPTLPVSDLNKRDHGFDVVFLATPAEVSADLAPKALDAGAHVIDLSGAFRLRQGASPERLARYQQWYGMAHPRPDLLDRAEFGLVPWSKGSVRGSGGGPRLIANPGCYATSVLMALLPLLKAGLIDPNSLVIDSKSGTSGAGRKAAEHLNYTEIAEECLPYRIGKHQHQPEIVEALDHFAGVKCEPFFTTHLLSVRRGILSSIYAKTLAPVSAGDLDLAFQEFYGDYPLVKFGKFDPPKGRLAPPWMALKSVVGSARCHIGYETAGEKLYVFSIIDNLLKGAASQAAENMNRLFGWTVETGLLAREGVL
jgi:N-acetyl-gamma-glutamyl-phosphate reductase